MTAPTLRALVAAMNKLTGGEPALDADLIDKEITARDADATGPFGKDGQLTAIRGARAYRGDRLMRVARPGTLVPGEPGRTALSHP